MVRGDYFRADFFGQLGGDPVHELGQFAEVESPGVRRPGIVVAAVLDRDALLVVVFAGSGFQVSAVGGGDTGVLLATDEDYRRFYMFDELARVPNLRLNEGKKAEHRPQLRDMEVDQITNAQPSVLQNQPLNFALLQFRTQFNSNRTSQSLSKDHQFSRVNQFW